jgi:hypothetical protein
MRSLRFILLPTAILISALVACGGAPEEVAAPPQPSTSSDPAPSAVPATAGAADDAAPAADEASVPDPPPLLPVGVPECDKFVEKYVACVEGRVPAEQKERLMHELHTHRARWRELEKMQDGKLAAGLACRGVAQRMKGDLTVDFGCEF